MLFLPVMIYLTGWLLATPSVDSATRRLDALVDLVCFTLI